jgi:SAM-dependent methyltransferase
VDTSIAPRTDYSRIAKYYDKVRQEPARIWLSKIVEYGEIDASCNVLDFGCGTGRFVHPLSSAREAAFCALELSREMLKQAVAKDRTKHILWVLGDGQWLPFQEDIFDCVYMTMVLHHIENKRRALQEIYAALKKSGRCVIMTTSHSRIRKHVLNDFPGVTSIDLKRFLSVPSLKKTMRAIGFRDVHYHVLQHYEDVVTDEYLERVRNKYISTLTLLNEDAFQKGFRIFEQRLRLKHGDRFRRIFGFVFVVGRK